MTTRQHDIDRRQFLRDGVRASGAIGLAGALGFLAGRRAGTEPLVWQIDPDKCIACGNCATYCVLDQSAVKCVHSFRLCGYCRRCSGYFDLTSDREELTSGAENQLCPTGAIHRRWIDGPYFEYTIDERLCIGCGKCVKGCSHFGNGSLYLQVRHDRCLNCNQCAIAVACPSQAFVRVPASDPYLLKHRKLSE